MSPEEELAALEAEEAEIDSQLAARKKAPEVRTVVPPADPPMAAAAPTAPMASAGPDVPVMTAAEEPGMAARIRTGGRELIEGAGGAIQGGLGIAQGVLGIPGRLAGEAANIVDPPPQVMPGWRTERDLAMASPRQDAFLTGAKEAGGLAMALFPPTSAIAAASMAIPAVDRLRGAETPGEAGGALTELGAAALLGKHGAGAVATPGPVGLSNPLPDFLWKPLRNVTGEVVSRATAPRGITTPIEEPVVDRVDALTAAPSETDVGLQRGAPISDLSKRVRPAAQAEPAATPGGARRMVMRAAQQGERIKSAEALADKSRTRRGAFDEASRLSDDFLVEEIKERVKREMREELEGTPGEPDVNPAPRPPEPEQPPEVEPYVMPTEPIGPGVGGRRAEAPPARPPDAPRSLSGVREEIRGRPMRAGAVEQPPTSGAPFAWRARQLATPATEQGVPVEAARATPPATAAEPAPPFREAPASPGRPEGQDPVMDQLDQDHARRAARAMSSPTWADTQPRDSAAWQRSFQAELEKIAESQVVATPPPGRPPAVPFKAAQRRGKGRRSS